MKMPAVGRNDPCPCGSGKKFKHCCLEKRGAPQPGRSAASVSDAIRKALEGRHFNSLEEMQTFLDQHTRQQNRRPLDEFHGLSPEQMHRMLNFPFASPELFRFPEVLDAAPTAPVLTLFRLLVDAIGEQGLKPTAKGNLPRNFCREAAQAYWDEHTYREHTRFGGINREEDFPDLRIVRLVAELAGLVRKYKGRFVLTRNCRRLQSEGGLAAVYPKLFRTYVEQFNWAYQDRYPELRFIQSAFLFTLYLLKSHGDTWQPHAFYAECFLRAFPAVLAELPPNPIVAPEVEVRNCYTWRTLVHFAGFLGLAAVEPISDELLSREYRVKALPLLREAAQFYI